MSTADGQQRRIQELEAEVERLRDECDALHSHADGRFQDLFEFAPVSIWEEDFSLVGRWFEELRQSGVQDIVAHLDENPDEIMRAASFVEIRGVNQAALELLGLDSKHRVIGNFKKIFKGETEHIFIAELDALWNDRERMTFEHTGRKVDGDAFHYLFEMYVPREQGRPQLTNVIVAITDITAHKQAEELRLDMEHMVRHDIKGPLTGVIGFSTLLAVDEGLTADQREMAKGIEESGYRMLELINRSLDMYKMETGRYRLEPVDVDLAPVLRRIVSELSVPAARTGVSLALYGLGEQGRFMVRGEELLLYTMVANLLKNAVEAAPDDSAVIVRLASSDDPEIVIHNMGAVPEVVRGSFFEKYATAGKHGGTGLGTYSASLIVRTHGGSINMDTSEAEGTTVTVRLPGPS